MKNTSKFWKVFKSMSSDTCDSVLQKEIQVENLTITDKTKMLTIQNQHFIASGMLFEWEMPLKTSQNSSYSDALKTINTNKSAGPDGLDPHLFAAKIISEPLTHI